MGIYVVGDFYERDAQVMTEGAAQTEQRKDWKRYQELIMIFQAGMNFFSSNFNDMGKTNQIYRGREIAHGTLWKCNLLRKMMRGDSVE